MDRRKFLVGLGGVSISGSALVGTGAFSRVESQRAVTVQVAEDPYAFLGLAKCGYPDDVEDYPNSSYAHLDEKGHLAILMNEENPDHQDGLLGAGVNSNSRTWFDNVFQICNQGKEKICVYIEDDDDWPRSDDEERRVDFYPEGNREESLIGQENEVELELGECLCVGIRTRTHSLSDGDELLAAIDNSIDIIADVECDPENGDECVSCPDDEWDDEEEGGRIGEITFLNDGDEKDITVSMAGSGGGNGNGPPNGGSENGDVLFEGTVGSGDEFTVSGIGAPPNIEFLVDGDGPISIVQGDETDLNHYHTSCSSPVYAGQRLHDVDTQPAYDLVVVSALHHEGEFEIC